MKNGRGCRKIKVVSNDIDTLATALYVTIDDLVKARPDLAPRRPVIGFAPQLTDADLVTLAVSAPEARGPDGRRGVTHSTTFLLSKR